MSVQRWALSGLLCCSTCSDDPPAVFATDHLVIEPSDSTVMCAGTLNELEAQVVRVAEVLEVALPSRIHVYYGPSAVKERCGDGPSDHYLGCARGLDESAYVATDYSAAYHEIVHAVRLSNGLKGPRFFEEGVAMILAAYQPFTYRIEGSVNAVTRGPEFLATVPWGQFESADYGIAAHFMSWLFLTYGDATVAAFLNDEELEGDVEAAFVEHFGLSLSEADDAWRATWEEHTWGQVCDPLRKLDWDDSTLEFTGRVACEEENTVGPHAGSISTHSDCFTVATAGTLRVELKAAAGDIYLRHIGDCSGSGSPESFQTKRALAGEVLELPFAACTWEIHVSTELTRPIDFSLRFTRV